MPRPVLLIYKREPLARFGGRVKECCARKSPDREIGAGAVVLISAGVGVRRLCADLHRGPGYRVYLGQTSPSALLSPEG